VRPRQRELRGTVIERRRLPDSRCVTCLASATEVSRHVIGIHRYCKIRRMTSVTVGINQSVIGIHMTRLTGRRDVRAGEGEPGRAVIKC
jgi:hypothetical protein